MSSKLSDLYVFIFLELILDESAMVLRYRTRRVSPSYFHCPYPYPAVHMTGTRTPCGSFYGAAAWARQYAAPGVLWHSFGTPPASRLKLCRCHRLPALQFPPTCKPDNLPVSICYDAYQSLVVEFRNTAFQQAAVCAGSSRNAQAKA